MLLLSIDLLGMVLLSVLVNQLNYLLVSTTGCEYFGGLTAENNRFIIVQECSNASRNAQNVLPWSNLLSLLKSTCFGQ